MQNLSTQKHAICRIYPSTALCGATKKAKRCATVFTKIPQTIVSSASTLSFFDLMIRCLRCFVSNVDGLVKEKQSRGLYSLALV